MSQFFLLKLKPRNQEVYSEFEHLLLSKAGKTHRRCSNNLTLPNILRTTDLEMEIYLELLNSGTTKTIKDLCVGMTNGSIVLHIISESILIFGKDRLQSNKLEKFTSWKITTKDLEICIRAVIEPSIVAIEYKKNPPANYNPKLWKDCGILEGAKYDPTEEDFKKRKSFIRKSVNPDEMNNYLLFIDAEFASLMADNSKAPLSVTIINGYGKTVMDTLITPRHRIIQLGDHIHGLKEKYLRNRMDEYEALKKIRSLCQGKILVGHDLQMELNHLCIDKQSLLGIRDLSGSKSFEKLNLYPKGGGPLYKLQTLASELLHKEIQNPGQHNSKEDTLAIMEIYRKIETFFIDDTNFQSDDRRRKIPTVSTNNDQPQSKKLKKNPTPVLQKAPIENVISAWQNNSTDLDAEESPVIALEVYQEELDMALFQLQFEAEDSSLNPVEDDYFYPVTDLKSSNIKPKLSICHLQHLDLPPKPINSIIPEFSINGEIFRTSVTEIQYTSDSGQILKWQL